MEFFDEVILSNTVRAYGIEAGIIILALLIKRYLSRYLASLLYRSFKKVWGNIEKQQFIDLVVQPLQLSVLLLIIVLSLDKLNFPEALNVSVYHITMQTLFERVGIGLIILSFTWVTLRLVDFIALVLEQKANLTEDQSDNQLIVFFKDFLKVFLVITGLLFILKFCFSQAIGPLIAGLGIAGAAIALAAKESLENIIASFIIFFDKPFTTGDIVKVQHVEGVIEHIGLRSTRIRTIETSLVTVPNKQMVDSILDNKSMRTGRRLKVELLLDVRTSSGSLDQLVNAIRSYLGQYDNDFAQVSVYFNELSANGALLVVEGQTVPIEDAAFIALRQQINLGIKLVLEKERVVFATPRL